MVGFRPHPWLGSVGRLFVGLLVRWLVGPPRLLSGGSLGASGPAAVRCPLGGSRTCKSKHRRPGKAVAVASTPARRATLRRYLADHVSQDVELLGCCTMVARRGLLAKETGRVTACKTALRLLACIRMPFERYMRACRTFALSRVSYGWLARSPALTLCKELWSNVHVGSRRIRAASIWLRAALWGGVLHLDILFAVQLVGVLSRIQSRRPLVWSVAGGTPAHALSTWLTCHGWRLVRPWVWYHDLTGSNLNFGVNEEVGLRQHIVRNAWRAWCLCQHVASNRRDHDIDCFSSQYFHRIDWKKTRLFAGSCPEARSVCSGASFSPAALGGRCENYPTTDCVWEGCSCLGTWDHIVWECPKRPPDHDIPPKPGEMLSSRFGWVLHGQNKVEVHKRHAWLTFVQKTIWTTVHGNTSS